MRHVAVFIATGAGSGYFPIAPGTAGSLVGLAVFYAVRAAHLPALEAAVILATFVVGVWAATEAERHFGREDPGPVVVDEILGTLVTLAFLPVSFTGAFVGFLVFRVLDIVKPWPANRFERFAGGLGIMADDAMAGVYGQLIMRVLCWAAPAWLLAA